MDFDDLRDKIEAAEASCDSKLFHKYIGDMAGFLDFKFVHDSYLLRIDFINRPVLASSVKDVYYLAQQYPLVGLSFCKKYERDILLDEFIAAASNHKNLDMLLGNRHMFRSVMSNTTLGLNNDIRDYTSNDTLLSSLNQSIAGNSDEDPVLRCNSLHILNPWLLYKACLRKKENKGLT